MVERAFMATSPRPFSGIFVKHGELPYLASRSGVMLAIQAQFKHC
jgi:hypothetical protein